MNRVIERIAILGFIAIVASVADPPDVSVQIPVWKELVASMFVGLWIIAPTFKEQAAS